MEIDEAIRASSDRRLQTKYNNAAYIIQRAFALYEFEQVAFSFNGGKDSTVLLHLLRAGYFLYKKNAHHPKGSQKDHVLNCPMRTIYFESPSAFPEINSFTYETASIYDLQLEVICSDFKSGLEALLEQKPTKAIFLGTRIGDPNAVGQEQFSPSSIGWPPFMRVNPILDWSYRDVWAFISTSKVQYCSLYDKGYTSIGSIYDTVPNPLLCTIDSLSNTEKFKPAYLLSDGRLERAGRARKRNQVSEASIDISNGPNIIRSQQNGALMASIIAVGDEILFGNIEDEIAGTLCRKLHAIGWHVSHKAVVRNEIDSVAEEVENRKSTDDLVFLFGGVGPLHLDVSMAGVAKAFGTRLAPDEEFEEYLRHLIGNHCTGDRNEMALLPEGITELLHHEMLSVPLIKCGNVVILSATNAYEVEKQWNCLLESANTPLVQLAPFFSKHLSTMLSDVELSETLSRLCLDFPDLNLSCHRKARTGPLIINFTGKDHTRVELAAKVLSQKYHGAFSEFNFEGV
ncbi:FAD synthase [Dioscorea cayenensis subsp. rotundata]|uniref:FAD synthase n=1 Tax=Dioscorea cayennensis subsp. rotundata TaxID=55577 RepID=A0AB40C100_DIOCR|nr:FAD synthase [Dioscorea cayenensis subsp. rotundata]